MRFEFATAGRILFGPGTLNEAGGIAAGFGSRALVVTGKNADRAGRLIEILRQRSIEAFVFTVTGEPTLQTVEDGVRRAKQTSCDQIVGMGGGSALDAGKAIAAMLTNPGELLDYVEVIGRGWSLARPPAPFIAIPTTAGTGTEVTRNAVLASPEHRVKVSLRSPLMLPRIAVVDPELTLDLPPAITASTGLDALTQVIEPYVSSKANPMTDAVCVEGMERIARSLKRAVYNGHDIAAREDMSAGSLMGGLALANAGLGAAHGFAAPIGGRFDAPHGAVCAALLPNVMRVNVAALRERSSQHPSLQRYETVARILTGNPDAAIESGIDWVAQITGELKIPGLGSYGITRKDGQDLCAKAAASSSMKANPIVLTDAELRGILDSSP
jgi:alcohol dehydrogenase class IV